MNHNNSHLDIFNGVTSLQELNVKGGLEMEENKLVDDFTDEDKVENQVNFWNYQDNPELIGTFDRFEDDPYGKHTVLLDSKGEELHLPNLIALNGKIQTAKAEKGSKVKIKFLGEVKSDKSGRTYKDFEIFVK